MDVAWIAAVIHILVSLNGYYQPTLKISFRNDEYFNPRYYVPGDIDKDKDMMNDGTDDGERC